MGADEHGAVPGTGSVVEAAGAQAATSPARANVTRFA